MRVAALVAAALLLAAFPRAVAASSSSVVINEVFYDTPSVDTGNEWIELANVSGELVDLAGWTIQRGGASFEGVFTFPSGAAIPPHSFVLVGESSVPGTQYVATLAFQNGGDATDGIRLVGAIGAVVDVLLYDQPNTNGLPDETGSPGTSFAPDVSEGRSVARVPDGADTNASGADFQSASAPTPGQSNSGAPVPSPSPSPSATVSASPGTGAAASPNTLDGVVVNELLPDPAGSDTAGEFIELWNPTSRAVDLGGAKLDDADGGSTPYTIPSGTVLAPGAYRSFLYRETKIAFNNDGDAGRVLAGDGRVVHALTYGKSPREGAAWARRSDGSAEWTTSPTPGVGNAFMAVPAAGPTASGVSSTSPSPRSRSSSGASPTASPSGVVKGTLAGPVVPLAQVRSLPLGSSVRTEGVISVPPGLLGEGVFYLAGSGLRVFSRGGSPPALALGDRVQVDGVVSSTHNERQVKVEASAVRRLSSGPPPVPSVLATGSVGEDAEGSLVEIHGVVRGVSGNRFLVDDGTGEVRVVVSPRVGWQRPSLRRGNRVTVVGVVSHYDASYRVLPRFLSDIRIEGIEASSPAESAAGSADTGTRFTVPAAGEGEPPVSAGADPAPSPTPAERSVGATSSDLPSGRARSTRALIAVLWSTAGVLGVLRFLRWKV